MSAASETSGIPVLDWQDFREEIFPQCPIVENPKDRTLLILIPEGEFLAGDENRLVQLPGFYLSLHCVTNAQFARFLNEEKPGPVRLSEWIDLRASEDISMTDGRYVVANGKDDHPVRGCAWFGASEYCKWAGLVLPHELEWEKGARGMDGREFPWGNYWDTARCRSIRRKGDDPTYSIWAYPAGTSPWGMYQMSGSVAEWTFSSNFWGAWGLYKEGNLNDDLAKRPCDVLRGAGSFDEGAKTFRCVSRIGENPLFGRPHMGFRCARRL